MAFFKLKTSTLKCYQIVKYASAVSGAHYCVPVQLCSFVCVGLTLWLEQLGWVVYCRLVSGGKYSTWLPCNWGFSVIRIHSYVQKQDYPDSSKIILIFHLFFSPGGVLSGMVVEVCRQSSVGEGGNKGRKTEKDMSEWCGSDPFLAGSIYGFGSDHWG